MSVFVVHVERGILEAVRTLIWSLAVPVGPAPGTVLGTLDVAVGSPPTSGSTD